MKKFLLTLCVLLSVVSFAGIAFADVTANMNVNATVSGSVVLSVDNLNFGNYDFNMGANAAADVTVDATQGLSYEITLDAGLNAMGLSGPRRMIGGVMAPAYLNYDIQQPMMATIWGDNGLTYMYPGLMGVGIGAPQVYPANGFVFPGQIVPPGAYMDVVLVTVIF